jgi:hypothetical protein
MQYKLLCKCWLYNCIIDETSISISLIHSRWLLNESKYMTHWQMSFISDFSLNVDSSNFNLESRTILDRYEHRGRILMKSIALQLIDLQTSISNAELTEEFAQKYQKMTDKLQKKWKQKEHVRQFVLLIFSNLVQIRSMIYKKNKSRKRALIDREAV